jgi:endonuclease/exonuclease/phosphatase family metal-dependent hydrolase
MLLRILLVVALFFTASNTDAHGDERPESIRVATWNVEWFFDDFKQDNKAEIAKQNSAPTKEEWEWKLNEVARVISELQPTILALQEVESRDVIFKLTKVLEEKYKLKYRYSFIDGFDFGTEQDVALMYQSGLVEFSRREQTQEMFETKEYYNLPKHLIGKFEWGTGTEKESLMVFTAHFRAKPEEEDLRKRQGKLVREWIKPLVEQGQNVIVLGDFNTEHNAANPVKDSDIGLMCGWNTEETSDDLVDLHTSLPEELRSTHLLNKEYDRLFVSPSLMADAPDRVDLIFSRIIARKDLVVVGEQDKDHFNVFYQITQSERDISDHYPVMAEFLFK